MLAATHLDDTPRSGVEVDVQAIRLIVLRSGAGRANYAPVFAVRSRRQAVD